MIYIFLAILGYEICMSHQISDISDYDIDFTQRSGIFIPVGSYDNLNEMVIFANQRSSVSGIRRTIEKLPDSIDKIQRNKQYSVYATNCRVKTGSNNQLKLIQVQNCREKLDIDFYIRYFFKQNIIDDVTQDFIQTKKLIFESMEINSDGSIKFTATSNGEIYYHVPSMIKLQNVALKSLVMNKREMTGSKTSIASLKPMSFSLTGEFYSLKTTISTQKGSEDIEIEMQVNSIPLSTFASYWDVQLDKVASTNEINFTMDYFKSLTMNSPTIKGIFKKSGDFQIMAKFKTKASSEASRSSAEFFFVINKLNSMPVESSFLVEYPASIKIQAQLSNFFEYKYEDSELTKALTKPWVFSASDNKVELIDNPDYKALFSRVVQDNKIQNGISLLIQINANCDSSVRNNAEVVSVLMRLTSEGLKYEMPPSMQGDLPAMMKCVAKGDAKLPQALFGSYHSAFRIKELLYNMSGEKKIVVEFPRDIRIFGPVKISNPEFTLSKGGEDKPWTFEGKAPIKIGPNITVSVTLSVDAEKTLKATIEIPAIDVESTAKAFGFDPFSNVLIAPFKQYLNFGVKDFNLEAETQVGKPGSGKLTMTGEPMIDGVSDVTLACYIWTPEKIKSKDSKASDKEPESSSDKVSEKGFALGVVIRNIRLDEAISKIIGKNISAAWFNKATFVVLVSTAFKNHCTNPKNSELTECKSEADKETDKQADKSKADESKAEKQEVDKKKKERNKLVKTNGEKNDNNQKNKQSNEGDKNRSENASNDPIIENGKESNKKNKKKPKEEKVKTKNNKESDGDNDNDDDDNDDDEQEKEEERVNPDDDEEDEAMKGGKHFKNIKELEEISIKRGLQMRATFGLPEDCKKDAVCEFLVEKVGKGAEIVLSGEFTTGNIEISAEINMNITLNNNTELQNAKLLLKFGADENKIEISCSFVIKEPALTLKASIGVSFSGKLEIGATMEGMWVNPLGLENLAVGNLLLKLGITITGLPSIEIGANIWIGEISIGKDQKPVASKTAFKFEGYFGFDPSDVTQSYFYARSSGNNLTIGNILGLLKIDVKLPQIVMESGFYNELQFSVNAGKSDKELKDFSISIPPGYGFKGELLFLNYSISCEFRIDWISGAFYLDAKFGPINDWANGLITIVRSPENRNEGPKLLIDIDPSNSKTNIKIEGYMHILGIQTYVNILLSEKEFKLTVTGDLWGVLKAQVEVHAEFSSLSKFSFKGCLQFDIQQIKDAAVAVLKQASKAADEAFKNAELKMNVTILKIWKARETVDGWKKEIDSYKERLRKRSEELEEKKKQLESNCAIDCGTVCVPFMDWNPTCWKVFGYWVGCPSWNPCRWKSPNLLCIAGCEIKKASVKFAAWAEQIGIKIMLGLSEIGQKLLDGVDAVISLGEKIVQAAQAVVAFVSTVTQGLIKLGEQIANFIGDLIVIKQFCVHGNIDPESKACMGLNFDITVLNSNFKYDGQICLDINVYKRLGIDIAEKKQPDIKDLDSKLEQIEGKIKTVEQDEKKMENEKDKTQANIVKETSNTLDINGPIKRSHVPTKEELYYYKLAYDPLPYVNIRNEETTRAMEEAIPWVNEREGIAMQRSAIFSQEEHHSEESHDSCEQKSNVISRYATITDGFHELFKSIELQKEGYLRQKRSQMEGLKYLDSLLFEGSRQNMTSEEQYEAAYWRNFAAKHLQDYTERVHKSLNTEKRHYISNFRNQFSDVLEKTRSLRLSNYIDHLHSLAIIAEKRSAVEGKSDSVPDSWNKIHKIMKTLATDEQAPIRNLVKKLYDARQIINSMKRSSIPCAA